MDFTHSVVRFSLLIILKTSFVTGDGNNCDCTTTLKMINSVRKDMFDLKLQNDLLTSRVDLLEQKLQQTPSKSAPTISPETEDAVTELKEDSKIARGNMWVVLNDTMQTDVTELQNDLGIIRQDNSKLTVDVSSVIDKAVLGEDVVCNTKCFVNGGECTGPGLCECPPGRSGRNCEDEVCELIPPINSGNIDYSEDRKVMSFAYFSCNDGYFLLPNSVRSSCTEEQKWKPEPPNCYNKELVRGFYLDGAFGSRLEYKSFPPRSFSWKTQLTLEFKTKELDGVLFYFGMPQGYDHMSVIIKEGHIRLSFNCGTGAAKVKSKGIYADGQWHTLTILRKGRVGMLHIDDEQSETVETGGRTNTINGRPPYLFGGIDERQATERGLQNLDGVVKSFKGCIANITLSGRDVGTPSNQFGTLPCPNDLFLSKTN